MSEKQEHATWDILARLQGQTVVFVLFVGDVQVDCCRYPLGSNARRDELTQRWVKHAALTGNATATTEAIAEKLTQAELRAMAAQEQAEQESDAANPKMATAIVKLVTENSRLFHNEHREAFALVPIDDHIETLQLRHRDFKRWLSRLVYERFESAPNSNTLSDAMAVLEARALWDSVQQSTHVRVAGHEGRLYLDLANEEWEAIECDTSGWRVLTSHALPVRFVRKAGMQALPHPVAGGSVNDLKPFVSCGFDDDWIMVVALLLNALRHRGPYAVGGLRGPQGCGKTTTARVLRSLIDPSSVPVRRLPRDERDLAISSGNSWLCVYDNLSSLSAGMSDALCCLSTGNGFATRQLFSDAEEALFNASRPVILTAIEDIITRPDLLDRTVLISFPGLSESGTRDEEEFWAAFESVRPRVLGALLDAVCCGLRTAPTLRLASKPRMADFAKWVSACESSLGWEPGTFLEAYSRNRREAHDVALESSPAALAVIAFVEASGGWWVGTASQLLQALSALRDPSSGGRAVPDRRGAAEAAVHAQWPRSAKALASELRRTAPNLASVGIDVVFHRPSGRGKTRRIEITKAGTGRPARSARSADPPDALENPDPVRTVGSSEGTDGPPHAANGPHENPPGAIQNADADRAGHADRSAATLPNEPDDVEARERAAIQDVEAEAERKWREAQ